MSFFTITTGNGLNFSEKNISGSTVSINSNTSTIISTNNNASYYPTFTTSSGNASLYIDDTTGPMVYNPSSGTLTIGNLKITDGTNNLIITPTSNPSTSVIISDVTSGTLYPVLASGTGTQNLNIDYSSGPFYYSPSTNTLYLNGALNTNTINNQTATSNLNISTSQTTGNTNLCTNASWSGTLNIGNSAVSGTINLKSPTTQTGQITITDGTNNMIITPTSNPATTILMTDNNTAGTFYITFSDGTTNSLYYDKTTSPLSYNPSTGTISPSSVSCNTFNATTSSSTVSIANTSTTGIINIGALQTTGNTNICGGGTWSGNLNLGNSTTSGSIICKSALTSQGAFSTSLTTAPSAVNHLGYTTTIATTGWTTAIPASTQTNITSVSFTSANFGTYLFNFNLQIFPTDTSASHQIIVGINTVSGNYGNYIDLKYSEFTSAGLFSNFPMLNGTRVISIYANTTVYLVGYVLGTAGTVQTSGGNGIFQYTRIA